jgi:hypothetical protein
LEGLQEEDWGGDEAEAAKVVAAAWTEIIETARVKNSTKGKLLRVAMVAEGLGLVSVAAAVLIVLRFL